MTPTATPLPISFLIEELVGLVKSGQVGQTSADDVQAAIDLTLADSTIADWKPCDKSGCYEVSLETHIANTFATCQMTSGEDWELLVKQVCPYTGIDLYKTYQALGRPEQLAAFNTFLAYIATRSDINVRQVSDIPSVAERILETLSSCHIGFGSEFCADMWR